MTDELKSFSSHKEKKRSKICLITDSFEEGRGGFVLNSHLIQVFGSIFTGQNGVLVIHSNCRSHVKLMPLRIARVIIIELKNTFQLIKLAKDCSIVFFTFGSLRFLQMLVAKILRKKTVYMISGLAGSELKMVSRLLYKQSIFGVGGSIFPSVFLRLEKINYRLSDVMVVESPILAQRIVSGEPLTKPVLNGALFVDTHVFYPKINLSARADVVSYFGALTEHKGVMNLIEAIPEILKQRSSVNFVIGGGPASALPAIERRLEELLGSVNSPVVFTGRVDHAQMPDYLNEAKLVVLPSYGEGLPNIVLEAMACGTAVLATQCGGIPDVIKDGETGFIMKNNSPQCIAKNVIRALEISKLEEIAVNARQFIEKEYTCEAAIERYKSILENIRPH